MSKSNLFYVGVGRWVGIDVVKVDFLGGVGWGGNQIKQKENSRNNIGIICCLNV